MSLFDVNFPLILATAVTGFLFGWLWYSPWLFGTMWANSHEKKMTDCKCSMWHLLGAFALSFLTAWALAFLFNYFGIGLNEGYKIVSIIWLGLIVPTMLSGVLWSDYRLKTFFIDSWGKLLALLVMSTVLLYWK